VLPRYRLYSTYWRNLGTKCEISAKKRRTKERRRKFLTTDDADFHGLRKARAERMRSQRPEAIAAIRKKIPSMTISLSDPGDHPTSVLFVIEINAGPPQNHSQPSNRAMKTKPLPNFKNKCISVGLYGEDEGRAVNRPKWEMQGDRLFLVGTVPRGGSTGDWCEGIVSAVAWDQVTDYLVFDSVDHYRARLKIYERRKGKG